MRGKKQRAESKGQRAKSREQRAKSKEQRARAKSREQNKHSLFVIKLKSSVGEFDIFRCS